MSTLLAKSLKKLDAKRNKARNEELAEQAVVQRTLQGVLDMLPAEVLLKHNMLDACKDRAKMGMIRTINRMVLSFQLKGFKKWKEIVAQLRHEELLEANRKLFALILGYLARRRVKKLKLLREDQRLLAERNRAAALRDANRCAVKIQAVVRGRLARCKVAPLFKKYHASRKIWNFYNSMILMTRCRRELRRKRRENHSVRLIQRVVRGRFGRKRAAVLRVLRHRRKLQQRYITQEEIFKFFFEQVAAAKKIQVGMKTSDRTTLHLNLHLNSELYFRINLAMVSPLALVTKKEVEV